MNESGFVVERAIQERLADCDGTSYAAADRETRDRYDRLAAEVEAIVEEAMPDGIEG